MVEVAVVGLGKMGMSHLAILGGLPGVKVVGVCDSTGYLLDVLRKNTALTTFSDYKRMFEQVQPQAVLISTPTGNHYEMVRAALEQGLHVFCEKPLTLDAVESEQLNQLARERGLVTQVGYHNRFVASFLEMKRLLDLGAIGRVSHVLAEAYGPVVLKAKGTTWRSKRGQGGGCLYDYAAHPLDLLGWFFGEAQQVHGSQLRSVFSAETDDVVLSTLVFPRDVTAQLSVDWSDESHRKMTTRITIWGEFGKLHADRQELQAYLRDSARIPDEYEVGQNVKYTTELTAGVDFYLRGEEYSAQLAHFMESVSNVSNGREVELISDFANAACTDRMIAQIVADANGAVALGKRNEARPVLESGSSKSKWKRLGQRVVPARI